MSDPRQHKFASCSRRATALGCLWSLAEGLGFCGTADSGMPEPCVQHAADPGIYASDSTGNLFLRLRLYFPPHLLICAHPKSCQPVGLLQFCGVYMPALGEGSSSWEMPAMLGLVSGPTSSHSGGQSTPCTEHIHQPSEYPSGVVDSIIFPLWFTVSTFFLPGLFFFFFSSLTFFFFPFFF